MRTIFILPMDQWTMHEITYRTEWQLWPCRKIEVFMLRVLFRWLLKHPLKNIMQLTWDTGYRFDDGGIGGHPVHFLLQEQDREDRVVGNIQAKRLEQRPEKHALLGATCGRRVRFRCRRLERLTQRLFHGVP